MLSVAVVMLLLACVAQCGVAAPHQCNELTRCRVVLWDHALEVRKDYVTVLFFRVPDEITDSLVDVVQVHVG